jgi:hypothetical protein
MSNAPHPPWPPHGHVPPQGQPPYGPPQPGPYGPPQPGAYGQPQPGAYGPPQPGPSGQPMHGQPQHGQPGPYGPPQPGPYGQPPYGSPQPGHWQQAPAKPKPTGGHLRIIGGLGLGLIMGVAWLQNAHEAFESSEGFGMAAVLSGLFGASLLLLVTGLFAAAKRATPTLALIGVPVGVTLLGVGVGPFASTAFCTHDEAQRWDELTAGAQLAPERWLAEYADQVHPKFQRPEWHARYMLARTERAIAAKDAAELRTILQQIAEPGRDPARYAATEQAASKAFSEYYEAAKTKLYAPSGGGGVREFPVDESLRTAFGAVLEDLAHAPTAEVHVAFANTVDLTPPEGTDVLLELYQSDPKARAAFPQGVPVIEPQQSFSPAYDSRRRQTFMRAMSESFGQVFDAHLLTLVPLEEGQAREGKIVIEVRSHLVRLPKFFFWEKEQPAMPGQLQVVGLLFGVAVDWELKVFGRDGTQLYAQPPVRSEPAESVGVMTQPGDPDWGMYSVLMDSAYYNYSRQVTGMFGLVPPPQKTELAYQGG